MPSRVKRERAEDLEAVRLFLDRAQRVEASTIVEQSVGTQMQLSWAIGKPLTWTVTEPRDDLLRLLLLDLRPLVIQGESINLRAIFGVGYRHLTSDQHRRALADGAEAWRTAHKRGWFALRINEQDLSPEHVMDLWINGWYFHSEPSKRAELEALAPESTMLTRQLFLDFVYRSIECVLWTASVLRDAQAAGVL